VSNSGGDIPEIEQIKDKDLLAFAVSSLRERETKLVWLAAGLFMLLLGAFITVLQGWCNIRKQC
jgi:hypothetical protein